MSETTYDPSKRIDERARVLAWLDMLRETHKRNSRERRVLDELRDYIVSGKPAPQGRLIP